MNLLLPGSNSGITHKIETINVDMFRKAPFMPKIIIDDELFDRLVGTSIELGSPAGDIIVRAYRDHYEVLYGECYFEAYKEAFPGGSIRVTVCHFNDEQAVETSFKLAKQAFEIDTIEIVKYYKIALEHFSWSNAKLGRALNENRSTVSNRLELLHLDPEITTLVSQKALTLEHAKMLARVKKPQQNNFARLAVKNGWDTRTLYRHIHPDYRPKSGGNILEVMQPSKDTYTVKLEEKLTERSGCPTSLEVDKSKGYSGKINFTFHSLSEMTGLVEFFNRYSSGSNKWKGTIEIKVEGLDHIDEIETELVGKDDF